MIDGVLFDEENHIFRHPVTRRRLLSVTDAIKSCGFIPLSARVDDQYRWRGREVHKGIHFIEKGTIDWHTIDPDIEPYLVGWQTFKKETGCITRYHEQKGWDSVFNYGGIIDWVGLLNGFDTVIDYKTGAVPHWAKYQTAGYANLLPKFHKRFALELRDNGTYRLTQPYTDTTDLQFFLSMVALTWEKINNGYMPKWEEGLWQPTM